MTVSRHESRNAFTALPSAGVLCVGAAAVTITPPDGIPVSGYYYVRNSEGVLDDIYAKAMVLDDGQVRAAMVVCDLNYLPRAVVVEARRIIEGKTGIPASNVIISATHAHTGPALAGDLSLDDFLTNGNKLSQDYAQQLPKCIAQAVEEAHQRRTPVSVSYGDVSEPNISFNRRFWMKDGSVGWNPGKLNPNIIRPIGPIDSQVNVIYAETADKRALLTYVNFALHLDTTGGTLISADYPATLARRLADYRGPKMLTIFANGASGDINHLDVNWDDPQTSPEEAKRLGTILAADVLKSFTHLINVQDFTIRVRSEAVQLPLAEITEEELRESRAIIARHDPNTPFLQLVKAYNALDVAAQQGKPFDFDVRVIGLGRDIAWVALPGEIFVELGLSIKAASPFRQTNVVGLACGGHYVPTRSAYAEGQYEVIETPFAEGAGDILVTTAIRLLTELHRDVIGGVAEKPASVT
jgi:neutral ceramidase